jgi:hypothetical protein
MVFARQGIGKNIPEFTLSTKGHPLLSNKPINTHSLESVFQGFRTVEQ